MWNFNHSKTKTALGGRFVILGSAWLVHTGTKTQQNLQPLLDFVRFF